MPPREHSVKSYKRILLIDRKLQLTVILYSVLLAAWVSFQSFIFQSAVLGRFGNLSKAGLYVGIPLLFLLMSCSVIFIGLIITNRIAGPIYRLRKHMEGVASGQEITEITFRKADYFAELIEPYNKIMKQLRDSKK